MILCFHSQRTLCGVSCQNFSKACFPTKIWFLGAILEFFAETIRGKAYPYPAVADVARPLSVGSSWFQSTKQGRSVTNLSKLVAREVRGGGQSVYPTHNAVVFRHLFRSRLGQLATFVSLCRKGDLTLLVSRNTKHLLIASELCGAAGLDFRKLSFVSTFVSTACFCSVVGLTTCELTVLAFYPLAPALKSGCGLCPSFAKQARAGARIKKCRWSLSARRLPGVVPGNRAALSLFSPCAF